MAEYIDKNIACDLLAKKALEEQQVDECAELTTQECLSIVRSIPTAKVKEIKFGKWEMLGLRNPLCSLCHKYNYEQSDFCPHCGADMRGAE